MSNNSSVKYNNNKKNAYNKLCNKSSNNNINNSRAIKMIINN